ncbi:MAG: transcription-repair coupling factor [Clostridia bacterium]|nr:transcription-repair coupling factor [Clostridia bacterium]
MQKITSLIRSDGEFQSFLSCLKLTYNADDCLPIAVNGLSGGAEAAFLAEAVRDAINISDSPILILVKNENERIRVTDALRSVGLNAVGFKKRELVFRNIRASHDVDRERLSVLSLILSGNVDAVVSTPSAAATYTLPSEELERLSIYIKAGDFISPEELADRLVALGFARVENVESQGQFSRRGGILDFFGGESESPVRIEFFGDEIDRLSYFDPISQRTVSNCDGISVLPATEIMIDSAARERMLASCNKLLSEAKTDLAREKLHREKAIIESGTTVDFRDKYLPLIYEKQESLFSYFGKSGRYITMVLGTANCLEELKKYAEYIKNEKQSLQNEGLIEKKYSKFHMREEEYAEQLSSNSLSLTVHINNFSGGIGSLKLAGLFGFRAIRCVNYGGNHSMLVEDLMGLRRSGYRILLLTDNPAGTSSLIDSLAESDIPASKLPEGFDLSKAEGGRIFVTEGYHEGFELITPRIAVLSMADEGGRAVMANRRRQRILRRAGGGQRLMSYAELSVGDYVVHATYGIGLFEGIETVTAFGATRDYITIKYAGTDKLFVPCDRLEMIGKYIGDRDKDGKVKLSKMGGTEWHRTKARAKAAAKDIAKSLIALYAERQRKPGFAFPEDCDLELQFEDAFEYEETESQLQAISEIKSDMMKPVPMNRLLCGDVGFGKTEVALRAAFKAIMGGKQVAFLVPTTILAMQHFQTALTRMRGFPVTVEMLTRFKKPKEQAEILRRVKRGETDILIGTHKLLGKNVEFRDLGLLIIDEEQRFGVSQKEKLKELARNVDVLTLTATPIPRTLNMAMNGISDISILDEAPEDRRPVQTYVLEHDDSIIYDAIRRELSRGGQVLYLYNKVESIGMIADRLSQDMPDARVAVAHGQMDKDELEDIWRLLIAGDIDILVCTTIIETGIDLPTANTLIIENAERFGLSQLHQIRGRVGRSERQAYAYLTYRPGKALTEIAEKRLSAIKEYAEFGAGFKIALCDLEIRGAGNLLGAQQHGYIDSVGYDLYVKLLQEAVLEERGESVPTRPEALIDMKISAFIPDSYIPSQAGRMEMYKKISLITCEDDASDVYSEIVDRYGTAPEPVNRLCRVAVLRSLCEETGFTRIECKDNVMVLHFLQFDMQAWSKVFTKFKGIRVAPTADRVIYKFSGDPSKIGLQIVKAYKEAKK